LTTQIKICGVTNLDDALMCARAGANFLGLNFYEPSPRSVDVATARAISDGARAGFNLECVGVFVNQDKSEVERIMREGRLDIAQLHGDETIEDCLDLKSRGVRIIKALRVGESFKIDDARVYADACEAVLLDAYDKTLYGGSGATFDWAVARAVKQVVPRLFLAGGLKPANVADAVRQVAPFAVDTASGVESAARTKDESLVRAFIEATRK